MLDHIPILKLGHNLLVTVQVDLYDQLALTLQADIMEALSKTGAKGVMIDISALMIVDSFMGRVITEIAAASRLLDAKTVVVGVQPAVAITLTELGLGLKGVLTALNVEKGMQQLAGHQS